MTTIGIINVQYALCCYLFEVAGRFCFVSKVSFNQSFTNFVIFQVLKLIHDGVLLDIPINCPPVICVLMNGCWKSDPKERLRFVDIYERLKNVTKRPELDSPLPRPPTLPVIVDHLSLRKMPSEELLDGDDYLQPDEQRVTVEYIMPYPAL